MSRIVSAERHPRFWAIVVAPSAPNEFVLTEQSRKYHKRYVHAYATKKGMYIPRHMTFWADSFWENQLSKLFLKITFMIDNFLIPSGKLNI